LAFTAPFWTVTTSTRSMTAGRVEYLQGQCRRVVADQQVAADV